MGFVRTTCTLILLATLVGCAQAPARKAFNREAGGHIKTVVVTQLPNQDSYEAAMLAHPGANFGLIGGLIAAADMQNKSTKLTAAIDPQQTRLQDRFSEKLVQGLTAAGYSVSVLPVPTAAKEDQVLALALPKATRVPDAVVMIDLRGAYWAAGPNTDYLPRLIAKVKTVDGAASVIYEDTFSYGFTPPSGKTVHMASDAQYRFATIDQLIIDPTKTRDGLLSGLDPIVAQIVADLKHD